MKRIVAVPIVLGLLLAGLLGWKLWQQAQVMLAPAGGAGTIEGHDVSLATRLTTRVAALNAREGQIVQAGDLLLTMDCADTQAMLAEAEARVEAARSQQQAAEAAAGGADRAYDAARSAASAAQAQARAMGKQADAAVRQADRLDGLHEDVSAAALDQSRAAADGMSNQKQAAAASGKATGLRAAAAGKQRDAAKAQAEAARSGVEAGEAGVQRARLLAAECEVRAPVGGIVELLPYEVGELVLPGSEVARVIDISTVQAVFYLPNADLGAARPGGGAEVHADAWPDEVFGGQVATVSAAAEFTPRNIQTRSDRDRLVYRVEVDVENQDGRLRPGMPVEVTLLEDGE